VAARDTTLDYRNETETLRDETTAAAATTPDITISTANPSGGADGDVWFQY